MNRQPYPEVCDRCKQPHKLYNRAMSSLWLCHECDKAMGAMLVPTIKYGPSKPKKGGPK